MSEVGLTAENAREKAERLLMSIIGKANQSPVPSEVPTEQAPARVPEPSPEERPPTEPPAPTPPGPRQRIAQEGAARENELLSRLATGADIPDPPQLKQSGIDTDRERLLVGLVQLAQGDTALTGTFAQTLEDEEVKRNLVDFQNAMAQHQVALARLEMDRQNSVMGIDAVRAHTRNELDALSGDIGDEQFDKQHALAQKQADIQLGYLAESQKANLFQRSLPILESYISSMSDEDAAPMQQWLVDTGLFNAEGLQALRGNHQLAEKVKGAAAGLVALKAEAFELAAVAARVSGITEDFWKPFDERARAIIDSLDPEVADYLRQYHPDLYRLGTAGFPKTDIGLPPAEPRPEDVADFYVQNYVNTDTFGFESYQQYLTLPVKARQELRSSISTERAPGGVPSLSDVIQYTLDGTGDTNTQRIAASSAASEVGRDLMEAGGMWLNVNVGTSNPMTLFVADDGQFITLTGEAALKAWAHAYDTADARYKMQSGTMVRPALLVLARGMTNKSTFRVVGRDGKQYLVTGGGQQSTAAADAAFERAAGGG